MRDWDCPHCGDRFGIACSRPVLHKICANGLWIVFFLTLMLTDIHRNKWLSLSLFIGLILAQYGLDALTWPPVVIKKPRPKDFIAEESDGKQN